MLIFLFFILPVTLLLTCRSNQNCPHSNWMKTTHLITVVVKRAQSSNTVHINDEVYDRNCSITNQRLNNIYTYTNMCICIEEVKTHAND